MPEFIAGVAALLKREGWEHVPEGERRNALCWRFPALDIVRSFENAVILQAQWEREAKKEERNP